MQASRKIASHCLLLGHGIAIACAICGLGMIIVAPVSWTVYGVVLLLLGIGIDMAVAVHCHDSTNYRRRLSNQRSRALRARKR